MILYIPIHIYLYLPIHLSISNYPSINIFVSHLSMSTYPSIYVYLSIYLYLPIYLFSSIYFHLSTYQSIFLNKIKIINITIKALFCGEPYLRLILIIFNILLCTQNKRKLYSIPENFNSNILHQLYDYTITFVNSQH